MFNHSHVKSVGKGSIGGLVEAIRHREGLCLIPVKNTWVINDKATTSVVWCFRNGVAF